MAVKPLKINTTNIKSPFGSGGSIPSISAGTTFNLASSIKPTLVETPTLEMQNADDIEVIKKDVATNRSNIVVHKKRIDMLSGGVSTLNEQLSDITAVINDIGNALSLDFANRITEQKKDNKALKSQVAADKRSSAESNLEGKKKIGKGIGSGVTNVGKAATGLTLGGIMDAAKLLAAGVAINALWPRMEEIFAFSMEHLDKILLVGGGLLALNVIGGIGTLLKFGKLFRNPTVLAGLAILVSSIAAERRKKKVREDFNKSHDDSIVTVEEFQEQNEGIEDPNKKKLKGSWWKLFLQSILEMGQTPGQMNFHDGGIVGGPTNEVAAVLERGEAVIPKELVSTLSQKPGINLIEMDLPPIRIPPKEKKVALQETTRVTPISSINVLNPYMIKTPELHGILV